MPELINSREEPGLEGPDNIITIDHGNGIYTKYKHVIATVSSGDTVYGGQQKLKIQELATISTPDTQTIVIDPWDKSIVGEIVKGIQSANIGMNAHSN